MSTPAVPLPSRTWQQMLTLMRYELWGTVPTAERLPANAAEWEAVHRMACEQTVDGVVFDAVNRLEVGVRPPRELVLRWFGTVRRLEQANRAMNTALGHLLQRLIPRLPHTPLLLKGQGVGRRYRLPEHRRPGDIDLMVGREGAVCLRACDAELGLTYEGESEKHLDYVFEGQCVEAHRFSTELYGPLQRKWLRLETRWLSEPPVEAVLTHCAGPVYVPPVGYEALYLFMHAYQHLLPVGVGLRQLTDWALLLVHEAPRIDRARLLAELDELGMRRAYGAFGYMLVHELGLPARYFPFDVEPYRAGGEWLAADVRQGGNFGKVRYTAADHAHTLPARLRRIVALWRRSREMAPHFGSSASHYLWERFAHIFEKH